MPKNNKYCLLTNDVETTSIWLNTLSDVTGKLVLNEGMPLLLDLYQRYNIKSTFFITGYIAQKFPEIVKMIAEAGHEIGSHSLTHKIEDSIEISNYKKQYYLLSESKKILEDMSGKEVIAFRSPALRVNSHTAKALQDSGYKIDSSIASQRFDLFFSFGALRKLKWLTCPRLPYRTDKNNMFKKGDSDLIEVPISATLLPYIGTTMRIFPNITKAQHNLLHIENSINSKPIVFDIHPNELIDESHLERKITRRSKNFLSYIVQDYLRSKLKTKNLGINALNLLEREVIYFKNHNYKFTSLKQYCTESDLL